MSSPLPKALRQQIRDAARDPDTGLVECARCGGQFGDDEIQVDHIVPEWLEVNHDPSNLQALCYPKDKGQRSCHKDKSAAEARQRASVRRRGTRSPVALPLAILAGVAAGVAARAAWLDLHGLSLAPLVGQTQTALRWWVISTLVFATAYALAHVGPANVAPDAPKAATGETPEQRLTAAVREEVGQGGTVRVRRQKDGGYSVSYRGTGFADHEDAAKFRMVKRISAKMGGRWQCLWDTEADQFLTRPRPDLPRSIEHPGVVKGLAWHQIPISPSVTMDLKKTPHVLVCGETSAGKTSIFRSAIISLAEASRQEQVKLLLLDPKRVELIGFRGWPGVMDVITDDEEMYNAPGLVVDEMNRRMEAFERDRTPLSSHQPWIVILDEYREYLKRVGAWSLKHGKRKTASAPLEPQDHISTLLAMARRMNIHLIIGTQRPDAKWFGGDAREQCGLRIGVGGLSVALSRMLYEDSGVGRDIPAEAKGRFTSQQNDGQFVEDQSYWVPDPTDADGTNTEADWALLERLGMPERTAA